MAEPFHSRATPEASLLGGMTVRRSTRALREIEEPLAQAPSLRELPADPQAGEVHAQVAQTVYGRAIDQVLEDQRLDPEEEAFLQRLRKELELPEDVAQQLRAEGAQRARSRFLQQTSVYDRALLAERSRTIELRGASTGGLEEAVRGAIAEAEQAVPEAQHFEVTEIRVEREKDGLRWQVVVRSRLERPDDSGA